MGFLWTIVLMAFIGALIGAFTNHIAILMLFRPHEAKYVGSWRLPFTPGLIPKRRGELATQLGRTVNDYLLTPDTFREKLLTDEARQKVSETIQQQATMHVFESDQTLYDWLQLVNGVSYIPTAERKLTDYASMKLNELRTYLKSGTVEEVIPEKWMLQFDEKVEAIPDWLLRRGEAFIISVEGRNTLRQAMNSFLEQKGTLGNMVQMMVGDSDTVVEKLQKEGLKFLRADHTKFMIHNIISKEWQSLKEKRVEDISETLQWDDIERDLHDLLLRKVNIEERLHYPLSHYWPDGSRWFTEEVLPRLVDAIFRIGEEKLESGLRSLKIDEMVEKQVNDFPIETLEGLVIQIATRELKMITVLGGVLGGMIGIVQGLIVFFTT